MILNSTEVGFDQGDLVDFLEEADSPGVVHAGCEHQQQIIEEQRLIVKVELQCLVVQLYVGNLWGERISS